MCTFLLICLIQQKVRKKTIKYEQTYDFLRLGSAHPVNFIQTQLVM